MRILDREGKGLSQFTLPNMRQECTFFFAVPLRTKIVTGYKSGRGSTSLSTLAKYKPDKNVGFESFNQAQPHSSVLR